MNATTMLSDRFFEIDGLAIRYLEVGNGVPAILLHGNLLGSSADVFCRNLGPLANGGIRVIAFDMPGFGLSDKSETFTASLRKGMVLKVMDALGLDHAALIAHSSAGNIAVGVALGSGLTSLDDVKKKGVIRVGTSRGNSETFAVVAHNMLTKAGLLKGAKIVVVAEYPAMQDVILAMKRGEIDGMAGIHLGRYAKGSSFSRANPGVIAEGKVLPILRYENLKNMVSDLVDKQALELIFSRQKTSRIYVLPPGVPKARVAALRKAFTKTMTDPDFIKAAKRGRIKIEPMSGARLQARIARLYAFPKAAVERAQWAIKHRPTLVKAKPKKPFKATVTGKKRMRRGMRRLMLIRADGSKATAILHSRRSRVTIAGKRIGGRKARRALKDGISCSIAWTGPGGTAMRIDCP